MKKTKLAFGHAVMLEGLEASAEEGFYFEPFLQLLANFNKLMVVYKAVKNK